MSNAIIAELFIEIRALLIKKLHFYEVLLIKGKVLKNQLNLLEVIDVQNESNFSFAFIGTFLKTEICHLHIFFLFCFIS